MITILMFLAAGAVIGILAGLLGVGGGAIVVPVLLYYLASHGVAEALHMKIALGTSFATIVMTGLSSVYAHNKKGSILWRVVGFMAIGCIIGVMLGSTVVRYLSNTSLKAIFCVFLAYTAFKMLSNARHPEQQSVQQASRLRYTFFGSIVGFMSSFVGIGGGTITVPLLTKVGHTMQQAIGSSSALGVVLALSGAFFAILNGWHQPMLPAHSLGYVYLPAFVGISIASMLFAPLGAKLVYILPTKRIRQIFAVFLLAVLIDLLVHLF